MDFRSPTSRRSWSTPPGRCSPASARRRSCARSPTIPAVGADLFARHLRDWVALAGGPRSTSRCSSRGGCRGRARARSSPPPALFAAAPRRGRPRPGRRRGGRRRHRHRRDRPAPTACGPRPRTPCRTQVIDLDLVDQVARRPDGPDGPALAVVERRLGRRAAGSRRSTWPAARSTVDVPDGLTGASARPGRARRGARAHGPGRRGRAGRRGPLAGRHGGRRTPRSGCSSTSRSARSRRSSTSSPTLALGVRAGRRARSPTRRWRSTPTTPTGTARVHVAKAAAGAAARRCGKDAMQIHGGIGYTWEHDLHLYLRRAYADEHCAAPASWHHDRLADLLFDRHEASTARS